MNTTIARSLSLILVTALLFAGGGCEQTATETDSDTASAAPAPTAPNKNAPTPQIFVDQNNAVPPAPQPRPITQTPMNAGNGARLEFETLMYDFGKMSETETRSKAIAFTNTGSATLVIDKITTSCGCTTTQLAKKSYAPGESGSILVTFEPTGPNKPGKPQRKYVNIISNGAAAPNGVTSVAILADVEPFINIEPRILQLGIVDLGQPYVTDITVSSADSNFTIDSVTASNPHVTTEIIDVPFDETNAATTNDTERRPMKTRIVRIHIDDQTPWGGFLSWLSISVTGRPTPDAPPKSHLSRVRIQGNFFGKIAGDPNTFRFGAQPNEVLEREIILTHRTGQPFDITNVEVNCTAVTTARVETKQLAPDSWLLTLHTTASANPSPARGTVRVTTTLTGVESVLDIPISGVVRPAAR